MPTVSDRKSYPAGSAAQTPESPNPDRDAVRVAALLETVRVPVASPAVVGTNVTVRLVLPPGGTVIGNNEEMRWNAVLLGVIAVMTRLLVPVFVTEKNAGALV